MKGDRCAKCRKKAEPLYLYQAALWCLPCRNRDYAKQPDIPVSEQNGRPPVIVEYEGHKHEFKTKAEARAVFRRKLDRKRLPSDIAAQIRGDA